jgi:hypothetical protein
MTAGPTFDAAFFKSADGVGGGNAGVAEGVAVGEALGIDGGLVVAVGVGVAAGEGVDVGIGVVAPGVGGGFLPHQDIPTITAKIRAERMARYDCLMRPPCPQPNSSRGEPPHPNCQGTGDDQCNPAYPKRNMETADGDRNMLDQANDMKKRKQTKQQTGDA